MEKLDIVEEEYFLKIEREREREREEREREEKDIKRGGEREKE